MSGTLQLSLFDERDLAEIHHPDFPGERLIACRNPWLADERAHKREALLQATERDLATVLAATLRTPHGTPVHSFRALLDDLATIAKNRVQPKRGQAQPFDVVTCPTPLQQQALDRLGLRL